MENPEKTIHKIGSDEVKTHGVPEPKKPKSLAKQEGSAHNADQNAADAKVEDAKPAKKKKPRESKPKEPAKPKVAAIPFQTTINPYGFIGLGKDELRAWLRGMRRERRKAETGQGSSHNRQRLEP